MMEQVKTRQITAKLDRPVALLGMMGAGKTYLGKALARALKVKFFDTDSLVEENTGRSVADIFAQDGEAAFRALEAETIAHLLAGEPAVISTGGGAVTNPRTLDSIKSGAYSVWVQASLPDMLERVSRNRKRPLLRNASDPAALLSSMLDQRKDLYAQADIQIMNRNNNGDAALDDIISALAKALKIF